MKGLDHWVCWSANASRPQCWLNWPHPAWEETQLQQQLEKDYLICKSVTLPWPFQGIRKNKEPHVSARVSLAWLWLSVLNSLLISMVTHGLYRILIVNWRKAQCTSEKPRDVLRLVFPSLDWAESWIPINSWRTSQNSLNFYSKMMTSL